MASESLKEWQESHQTSNPRLAKKHGIKLHEKKEHVAKKMGVKLDFMSHKKPVARSSGHEELDEESKAWRKKYKVK